MTNQINSICKSVNFHICNLWHIRRFLTRKSCCHAVIALVLSHIDYANSLLYDVREVDLQCMQCLQNKQCIWYSHAAGSTAQVTYCDLYNAKKD